MARVKDIKTTMQVVSMGEMGGRERILKYDLNSFAELETRFGTIQKAMEELQKGSIKSVKIILWAGLIHDEAVLDEETGEPIKYNISPFQVGSWINPQEMPKLMDKLSEAMSMGLPDNKEALEKARALLEDKSIPPMGIDGKPMALVLPDENAGKN